MKKSLVKLWPVAKYYLFSKNRVLILVVIMALLTTNCSGIVSKKNHSIVDKVSINYKHNLYKLKIGLVPTENPIEQERMMKALKEYLEQSVGGGLEIASQSKTIGRQTTQNTEEIENRQNAIAISLDFQIGKSYQQIIDLLVQGKLDMAYLGPLSYVEAVDRGAKIEPLVAAIDKHTGQPWYRACIIVKQDSPIKTLKDLKGKRIALVDKLSTSGYLMPLAIFKKLGIDYQHDFAKVLYTGSHSKSLAALEDGIVDAAATNISSYFKEQKIGKLTRENSRVVWQSTPILNFPIVVSKKLPPDLIQKLKQALISSPEGLEDILGIESAGYTLVTSSDYASIEQLRKELNLISVPAK
ncbi:phosphonate ABC transporter substrate-binding protein [Nostoc linckia z18]|uniref:Phosphonate ABC transporter substrate-binding protein n=2 Tax=Nostoc linckia TaxID=92942 RepID=A0A9Q6EIH3_NOSLI|nr:phosphate/phosphite/phosphonate ABC transporter substrate-binding protein [Nostoc linckia]PHJ80993.1 phosphonate ABC transporter substrate-binding protein [Nostoc linckia z4]PHJ83090.1 phosphonate ABC transporter substrate-binding protein [Nostoc linckia z6]PHK03680.1 phosphonate ABC transporter substrate-binding protein [Nostoc linckia z9]PHK35903.1 phosphonate ABC transporter substrate-binding protein [Nostoc linckia z15]PHK43712.1 phosphonate ABC transporter substrate-binding protein [No